MIDFKNVSFTYENGASGVYGIDLHISRGEFVLLCGTSGCGKTTVTRLINGLVPSYHEGTLEGSVTVCGKDISKIQLHEFVGKVGSVFQNPRSQFFTVDTTSELAFGCENMGVEPDEIKGRIEKTVKALDLQRLMDRNIFMLSGGEKQKIACGSVMALEPEIYIFDEPSSNLDTQAIGDLRKMLMLLKEQGKTIIAAEHRLFYLADLCDRVILMDKGKIVREFSGKDFKLLSNSELNALGLRTNDLSGLKYSDRAPMSNSGRLCLCDFNYTYKHGKKALDIPCLELPEGAVIALIGNNGAGKSTFSKLLAGLIKDRKSTVTIGNKRYNSRKRISLCYMVMQDVNHQLFTESVIEEVMLSQEDDNEETAKELLKALCLEEHMDNHPMSLSGGQKQRVAICSAFASECGIVIYDEPTSGLDFGSMNGVSENIRKLKATGKTQIIVTHDPELILSCCDHIVHLENGTVKDEYLLDEKGAEKMLDSFISDYISN